MLRRFALAALVLLVACGRPGGAIEEVGSRAQLMSAPGSPPPPATLGWPSPAVVGSERTGTLPGQGSVGVAGDYRYTLPIEVPPGRAGMAPSLSLSYSSSGENGIAGVGWSLTAGSAIKPCNKTIATDGVALENEESCLDGQRLVSLGEVESAYPGDDSKIEMYRTEADSFARVEATPDSSNPGTTLSFRAFLKDGRIRSYARDPKLANEFLLAMEEDRFGNTITYSYIPPDTTTAIVDPVHPAPLAIAEETARLGTINYTGRLSSGDIGSREVWLKYEDSPRPDPIFVTDSTPATSSKKRLKSIDCYAPAPGAGTSVSAPTLAWSYALSYTLSTGSGRSLLTSVKRTGTSGSAQFAKEFEWRQDKGGVYEKPNAALPQEDTAGNFLVLDVDHDGRDELLYSPPAPFSPHVLFSTVGAGLPLLHSSPITGLSQATLTDASVGDIDGDGLPEIIAPDRNANAFGIKPYQVYRWSSVIKDYVVATQANKPWLAYRSPAYNSVEQPIFLVDMDGDGLPDMIQAQFSTSASFIDPQTGLHLDPATVKYGNYATGVDNCVGVTTPDRPKCLSYDWYYFHNDGGTFGAAQLIVASTESFAFAPRSGSPFSASVLGDRAGRSFFTGMVWFWPEFMPGANDGSNELQTVRIYPYQLVPNQEFSGTYNPKCIYGNFTGRGNEPVCDALPYPWRATVFDFDGDGRDELFEYAPTIANGTFLAPGSKRISFDGSGIRHEDLVTKTPLATGDFNGDGLQDAIFYDLTLGGTVAELNAGATQDLMVGVRNETAPQPMETVTYSQRWSADPVYEKICTHPQVCLRQGMNVVVEHDVYQGSAVGTYEHSFFNYEDPRADVHGRGFLGFATVRAWNPDRLSESITEYDNTSSTNSVYFDFMPSRVTRYTAIAPVDDAHREYTVRASVVNSSYAVDQPTISTYFRHPTTWSSAEWETSATIDMTVGIKAHFGFAGPAPTPLRKRNGESSFDAYGNQTYSRSETVGGVKTEVTSAYNNSPKSWRIGEVTQTLTTVTEPGAGTPVPRQVDHTYGSKGERKSSTIEAASSDAAIKYTTSFKYNSDGLVISKTGSQPSFLSPLPPPLPEGDADRSVYTEYDPDEGIFPRKVWNDLGHVARTLYHPAFGTISDAIDANGVESQVVYDGLGRTRKTSRAGETPIFIHAGPRTNAGGQLIGSYVDASGSGVASRHSEYDENGHGVLQSHVGFDGTAILSQATYDGLGRLHFASRSGFGQPAATGTTYTYDGLDRLKAINPPNGKPTISSHSFFETHTTDPVLNDSYIVRDMDGRVVKSVEVGDDAVPTSVAYKYGNFNQIKTITDSLNNVSRFYYDQRGRRVNVSDPDTGGATFHYNAFGDLTEMDLPGLNGSTVPAQTVYTRDALGRVVQIDDGDGKTVFAWDTGLNGVGLLASQSNKWVAQTFEYDWYGRPSREVWTVDNESFDVLTSYDGSGRVSTISYPEVPGRPTRFTVQRNYSSTHYFASVEETDLPSPVKLWEVLARNADDQLLQGQFGNGRLSKRVYEPTMGRLKSITDMACVGVNCIGADYSLGYTYHDDGNVATRTDYVTSRSEKFGYDALNRVKSWTLTYGGSTTETGYSYDEIGNLMDVTVGVGGPTTESNSYYPSGGALCAGVPGSPCPGPHALQSAKVGGVTKTFEYDTRGRQVKAPGRGVAFSEADLPTAIETAAGTTVFSYDAAGSRVKKVGPSEETLSLGGLYERRVMNGVTQHVFFVSGGDGNMTQVGFTEGAPNSDRIEYLHTDALGSTAAVTDDTGGVTRSYREPFGARIDANGAAFSGTLGDVRLGFTGHVSDDDLGLVNMKGRIYDPTQRRFISPDPMVSSPGNTQSYNRYSYVRNNPLYFTDPSGFWDEPTRGPSDPVPEPFVSGLQVWAGIVRTVNAHSGASATPFHAVPTTGGSAGASSVHAANVHHDRKIMSDLDDPGPGVLPKVLRVVGDSEPGARAVRSGTILADWLRHRDVPPDGLEMKALMSGLARIMMQAKPLLATKPTPAPPGPPVAPNPAKPTIVRGSSGEDVRPANHVRDIAHNEKLDEILDEVANRTFTDDVEHSICSMGDGSRCIFSGGKDGIDHEGLFIARMMAHSHGPDSRPGASPEDIEMLDGYSQRHSWLIEVPGGGEPWSVSKFTDPNHKFKVPKGSIIKLEDMKP